MDPIQFNVVKVLDLCYKKAIKECSPVPKFMPVCPDRIHRKLVRGRNCMSISIISMEAFGISVLVLGCLLKQYRSTVK